MTPRRPGFTLIEMMLAAMVTALVAVAGATLISATSNASLAVGDIRKTRTAGQYALSRITNTIRQARAVGAVSPTSVTLWIGDYNDNDTPDWNEIGFVYYDGATDSIRYLDTKPQASWSAFAITVDQLKSVSAASILLAVPSLPVSVWGEDIQSFRLTGYPDFTDTSLLEVKLTVGEGGQAASFRSTASIKASADYLFAVDGTADAPPGSDRTRRMSPSWWSGP